MRAAIRQVLFGETPFSPRRLFNAGEQGVWYDISDWSTLFQDAAGTTAVTAVEQPVGLILDKSGRGNHASQSTTTSRPTLRNLYNLLTYTEEFDNAAWTTYNTTVLPNQVIAPDGATTADKLLETATTNSHVIYFTSTTITGVTYSFSVYVKAAERQYAFLQLVDTSSPNKRYTILINLSTGELVTQRSLNTPAGTSYSITSAGNGWWRISSTLTQSAGTILYPSFGPADSATPTWAPSDQPSYAGDITKGIYIWGAQLTPNNEASIPYQRVVTNTLGSGVYDTDLTKFPVYLRADRTDDSYTTADGGGSTTGFFYCASILLQTAGQTHTLISDTGTNTGYRVRINSSNQLELSAGNGSAYTTATTTDTLSTGQLAVITAWHDGTKLYAQINNGAIAEQAFGAATAGTAALTIGKDNGAASSYFGGGIYYHVYRKDKGPTDIERAKTKALCAAKGGITL